MKLAVTVQLASPRRGVPHARSLSRWANAAFTQHGRARDGGEARALTIRIVGAAESRKLNRTWRGKDKPTNVLSFPSDPLPLPRAARGRARSGHPELLPLPLPRAARGRAGRGHPEQPSELGDLAICAAVVAREAREQGKPAQAHWAHMVIHGVLHLLGYDHEHDREAAVMEAREVQLLAQFGYANPYA